MFEVTQIPEMSLLIEFKFSYEGEPLGLQAKIQDTEEGDMVTMLVFNADTHETIKVTPSLEACITHEVSKLLDQHFDGGIVLEKRIQH